LCEEKTKGNRWSIAELNTIPRCKAGVPKDTQKRALIDGKYIFGPGVMMYRDMEEGMVVSKRSLLLGIFERLTMTRC